MQTLSRLFLDYAEDGVDLYKKSKPSVKGDEVYVTLQEKYCPLKSNKVEEKPQKMFTLKN